LGGTPNGLAFDGTAILEAAAAKSFYSITQKKVAARVRIA